MIAAIHQPNFLPWLGYFRKIARADAFVFLDHVQFPRTGAGNWVNRVRVRTGTAPGWLTCPVRRSGGSVAINAVSIDDGRPWRRKSLTTLEVNYRRSPFFKEVWPTITRIFQENTDNLADFNIRSITGIAKDLGIGTVFIRSSSLALPRDLAGSALLAHICKEIGAKTYLAGDGAAGYEDVNAYSGHGVTLMNNCFVHPEYPQRNTEFHAGLSVVDAMFNLGSQSTGKMIRS